MSSILIAEDDPLISSFLMKGLRANGFTTLLAEDGDEAERAALGGELDLIILDMGLPGKEGFEVLRSVRQKGLFTPVLVLTGRPERDVVMCLEAGANDYMTKPFDFDELLARVRTRLRDAGSARTRMLTAGGIRLDLLTRRVSIGERTVELTAREFGLLEALLRHPERVHSREELLAQVWGYGFDPDTNLVNVYVNSLRKKLGADAIETIRGTGYRVGGQPDSSSRPAVPHAANG